MGETATWNRATFYLLWLVLAGALTAAQPGFGVAALLLGLFLWVRVR
ncbi:hypothetical protein ACPZ19_43640 [Amycolatopsis lurida]